MFKSEPDFMSVENCRSKFGVSPLKLGVQKLHIFVVVLRQHRDLKANIFGTK